MKISFFFTLLALSATAFGQNKVFIKGYVEEPGIKAITLSPALRDPVKGWVHLDAIKVDSTGHFAKAVTISRPGLIYIFCGDYLEAFVKPGDSLTISIKKLAEPVPKYNGLFQITPEYLGTLSGTHSYNNFFSELESQTGRMDDLPYLIDNNYSLAEKKSIIKDLYNKRILLLNNFRAKYPEVESDFYDAAFNDIKGQYFAKILFPPHKQADLPPSYLEDVKKEVFSFSGAASAQYYTAAANIFFTNYVGATLPPVYSSERFEKEYLLFKDSVTDTKLKNYFLTATMIKFLDKEPDNYQEILEHYKTDVTDSDYKKGVIDAYERYYSEKATSNQSITLTDEASKSRVYDVSNKEFSIKDILSQSTKKLILIDIWASWCGPCVAQLPEFRKLKEKYSSSIEFVSLSEDRDVNRWKAGVTIHKMTGKQYLMNLNDKGFIRDLKILTIPRYILLKSSGETIRSTLPNVLETEHIEKILDEAIKTN
jgi:thiol-disulfide isomerase/thioredoxin